MLDYYLSNLQNFAFLDLVLPFILIFTILFVFIRRYEAFNDRIALVLSLVIALITIMTHQFGLYPPCWDVVDIINGAMPKITLFIIAIAVMFIVLSMVGIQVAFFQRILAYIAIGIIGFVSYTFLTSGGPGCELIGGFSYMPSFFYFDWIYDLLEWVIPIGLVVFLFWFLRQSD